MPLFYVDLGMAKSQGEDKFNRRRVRASYLSVTISIGMVLFLLGLTGTLLYQARTLTEDLKENFTLTLFLETSASNDQINDLQSKWGQAPEVRSIAFVSKEEAAAQFAAELGQDFIDDILGVNPLSDAIELKLHADYVNQEQLAVLKDRLQRERIVDDIMYAEDLLSAIHQNVDRIMTIMLAIILGLLLISIALINSSIRLSIYARRFSIKTMQLVGATRSFIHRPFLAQGARLGAMGAGLGSVLLALAYVTAKEYLVELQDTLPWSLWASLALIMLVVGMVITMGSTAAAVSRYLALKTNQLYEK